MEVTNGGDTDQRLHRAATYAELSRHGRCDTVVKVDALGSSSTPNGIRTRVSALKGRCPRPLDDGGEWSIPGDGRYQHRLGS
jgi:hypothetical protein